MAGVPIQVIYDPGGVNDDITDHIIFNSARLESSVGAQPGLWQATLRDTAQALDFTTGKRVIWKLDGQVFYAGFLTQVSKGFAFPADDTTSGTASVKTRQHILRGADYNLLFDKRVIWNPDNPLESIPRVSRRWDAEVIDLTANTYLQLPGYIDTTTHVDNVAMVPRKVGNQYAWMTPGTTWRQEMDALAKVSGAMYYIKPDPSGGADLYWIAEEDNVAPYELCDAPQLEAGSHGFRELDYMVDASGMVNDALVWGGNEFTDRGTGEATVFARDKNEDSITDHGRWQWAETHFGDTNYASQEEVDNRAEVIVQGRTGDAIGEVNRGLQRPNKTYRLAWHDRDIPTSGGNYQFIYPGDLTTLKLYVFGDPLVEVLPCRSITVSFPGVKAADVTYVRFEGSFSLQRNDPYTLWLAIKRLRKQVIASL